MSDSLPGGSFERGPNQADRILLDLARDALKEKVRSRRWKIFFRLIFISLLLFVLVVPWISHWTSIATPGKHAAVIEINGVIAASAAANADDIIASLEAAFASEQTAGVLLSINSPGGSPVQAGMIFDEILRLRGKHPDTPVYAVIADICASGGYYIAAAADRIYADRASAVGSIGVRLDSFGVVDAMEKLGIERRLVTAGENKALLDPFLPQNPQHLIHLQQVVDDIHRQFIDAVKRGRGERLKDNGSLFSGLFWSGEQALDLGLVDELSSEKAVAREVLGVEKRVDYTYRQSTLEKVLGEVRETITLHLGGIGQPLFR